MTLVHALALGRCLTSATDVHCHHDRVQLSATVEVLDGPNTQFLELASWPEGRFEPAWLGDIKGWSASVTDGTRGQIVRWWVADGKLLTISATGPLDEVRPVAARWMDSVAFADLGPQWAPAVEVEPPVRTRPAHEGGRPLPPRSSSAAAR